MKGFNCVNTTLIIPASKYATSSVGKSQGDLLSSEISSLSETSPISPSPHATVSLINALSESPYNILSFFPPSVICNFLNPLTSSPTYLQSIDPSTMVSLIETLCSSPSLMKIEPICSLIDFLTAVALSPKIMDLLPPSTTICLLNKILKETPDTLFSLSPAVRNSFVNSVSSPEVLKTLEPLEISCLINVFLSSKQVLSESRHSDQIELLKMISSSSTLIDNIPTSQLVSLLYQMSKLAPSLLCSIPPNVMNTLLAPIVVRNQLPTTIIQSTAVISSSKYVFNTTDPSILSSLLIALSQPDILCAVSPPDLIKLLTDLSLSDRLMKTIKPEAIISLLHSIETVLPGLICIIPPSVRSTFALNLTSIEVTNQHSIPINVKLIEILSNTPCFLAELPIESIDQVINFMISYELLINAIPIKNIVNFIHNMTVSSPFLLRKVPTEKIQKLLSPLNSLSLINSLDSCCYVKLMSSLACSPFLMNEISEVQIGNILTTLNSSPTILKEIPPKVYTDILTQIFMTPKLLSKIPLPLLLNWLRKIEDIIVVDGVCSIPPSAISMFMDFLGDEPTKLTSLPPPDITNLVYILAKIPYFLAQISMETLGTLLDLLSNTPTVLNGIPREIRVKLVYSMYSLAPSLFCSLKSISICDIVNSISSFDTLSSLSSESLIELTTAISECPCFLSVLDDKMVTKLLDALSACPSTLSILKPCIVVDLITSISASELLSTSISTYSYIRFLQAFSTIAPSTLCFIPTSVYVDLLNPLKSLNEVNKLTSTDIETIMDILIRTPCILGELPRDVLVNLMMAISKTFTIIPNKKIITLLNSIHSVSPSLMCTISEDVLTNVLERLGSHLELSTLPPECIVSLTCILSSSPCLLNIMPASTLSSFLGLLSSSPKIFGEIPSNIIVDFFTKLSLTPSKLKDVKLSLLISSLSTIASVWGPSVCGLPPTVMHALLISLSDAKKIYQLHPSDIVTMLDITSRVPCILNAIAGDTLNTLLTKVASSPDLLSSISPDLVVSFLTSLTSSPSALNTIKPITIVNLLITIAHQQPSILFTIPETVASILLDLFNSQQVFASLPPPVVNNFINLLMIFPKLFTALPLSSLNALISFLSSFPIVLSSLPTSTLVNFLTLLSSLPPLLDVLSPCSLIAFISVLSTISPQFLCSLQPSVVPNILRTVFSEPALASMTPTSIVSLISDLNRSSCLIPILPLPMFIGFFTYLSHHPNLLSSTPKNEFVNLLNKVKLPPGSIPFIESNASSQNAAYNYLQEFSSNQNHSTAVDVYSSNVNKPSITQIMPAKDAVEPTIFDLSKSNEQINTSKNSSDNPKPEIDQIPTLLLPENVKNAKVLYCCPKNNKRIENPLIKE